MKRTRFGSLREVQQKITRFDNAVVKEKRIVSRVGRKPITIAAGVKVQKTAQEVSVKGPKGELTARVHHDIGFEV